jgi:EAL domain-containing protein (putative c-di-GMP-specific phosphodiesterase class I)
MPAEYLVLEITERTLLRSERHGSAVLQELQRIGARLAVDDYGTGYSSLATLRNLHARQVKLDRTFIQGLPGDGANEAIVRSTIELAHTLGATVVAEGVETREQWNHLAHVGCDVAQGFLIGDALAPDALLPFLQTRLMLRSAAA